MTLVARDGLHAPSSDAGMFAVVFPSGSLLGTLVVARLYERIEGRRQAVVLLSLSLVVSAAAAAAAVSVKKAGRVALDALTSTSFNNNNNSDRHSDEIDEIDLAASVAWTAVKAAGVPWNLSIAIFLIAMSVSIPYYIETTQTFPSEFERLVRGPLTERRGERRRGRGRGKRDVMARTQSVMDGIAYTFNLFWNSLVVPFLLGPDEEGGRENTTRVSGREGGGRGEGGGEESNNTTHPRLLAPPQKEGWVTVFVFVALLWLPIGWLMKQLVLWREKQREKRRARERKGGRGRTGHSSSPPASSPFDTAAAAAVGGGGVEGGRREPQEEEEELIGVNIREIEMQGLLVDSKMEEEEEEDG